MKYAVLLLLLIVGCSQPPKQRSEEPVQKADTVQTVSGKWLVIDQRGMMSLVEPMCPDSFRASEYEAYKGCLSQRRYAIDLETGWFVLLDTTLPHDRFESIDFVYTGDFWSHFSQLIGDVTFDGKITISDIVFLVAYLFKGQDLPVRPD